MKFNPFKQIYIASTHEIKVIKTLFKKFHSIVNNERVSTLQDKNHGCNRFIFCRSVSDLPNRLIDLNVNNIHEKLRKEFLGFNRE